MSNFTEIPLFSAPFQEFSIAIEGVQRILQLYWNDRDPSWHFNLLQNDRSVIVEGIRLVTNYPILADYALQGQSITGWFYLTDTGERPSNKLNESVEYLPQYYRLFYVYPEE